MDLLDEEILSFWKLLNDEQVEYILVGGFAVTLHGHSRATGDIDLWIKDSATNRQKLRKVIEELTGADYSAIETMQFVPGWSSIHLGSGFVVDIMTFMAGFEQERFDECFRIATIATVHEVPIRFLHYNQMIESKKATGRPKDLLDIEELERIHRKD